MIRLTFGGLAANFFVNSRGRRIQLLEEGSPRLPLRVEYGEDVLTVLAEHWRCSPEQITVEHPYEVLSDFTEICGLYEGRTFLGVSANTNWPYGKAFKATSYGWQLQEAERYTIAGSRKCAELEQRAEQKFSCTMSSSSRCSRTALLPTKTVEAFTMIGEPGGEFGFRPQRFDWNTVTVDVPDKELLYEVQQFMHLGENDNGLCQIVGNWCEQQFQGKDIDVLEFSRPEEQRSTALAVQAQDWYKWLPTHSAFDVVWSGDLPRLLVRIRRENVIRCPSHLQKLLVGRNWDNFYAIRRHFHRRDLHFACV